MRREHAIGRLFTIFSERLSAAKGDRNAGPIKEFADVTIEQLDEDVPRSSAKTA